MSTWAWAGTPEDGEAQLDWIGRGEGGTAAVNLPSYLPLPAAQALMMTPPSVAALSGGCGGCADEEMSSDGKATVDGKAVKDKEVMAGRMLPMTCRRGWSAGM